MKVWRYARPNTNALEGWFVAFVDAAGCVAVLSDYGDYSYHWGAVPDDVGIRRFLTQCDRTYVLRKFAPPEFDLDATQTCLREAVREFMGRADINPYDYDDRSLKRAIDDADSEHEMIVAMEGLRDEGIDVDECWRTGPSHRARAFMDRVWPRLIGEIKSELESESLPRVMNNG